MSLIEHGRKEITEQNQLKKFPIGSSISYSSKTNAFKPGGFIWKIADDNFIYLNLDTDKKFRVQMKNVDKIWVGSVYDVKNDVVSLVKTTKKKTINPVKVGGIVVNYTKNKYDYERYICTHKYKLMKKWYETFGQSLN